jgi:DNA polymerase-3 subunit delta'
MKRLREMKTYEIGEIVKELSENKKIVHRYLDMIELWFRDVLLYKATQDPDSMVFRRELVEIRRESAESSYEGLEEILRAVGNARTRLSANVNFDLTMELLFMTIAENLS